MQGQDIRADRLVSSEAYGDEHFDDRSVQEELRFEKAGDVVFDRAGDLDLEYRYPSTIGMALFFFGSFEGGESTFVTSILRQTPHPVIMDVGANIGTHAIAWAKAVPDATCYAFEPVPANRALLERNVARHTLSERVFCEPQALGADNGTAMLHECDDAAYSSLRDTGRRPVTNIYEVPVTTIDSYILDHGLPAVDLIKIDVEGLEDDVLRGAERTIERFHPHLFVEISAENQNGDPDGSVRGLLNRGYEAYVINDGLITKYERHDDRFYNYFFVHASRQVVIPPSDLRWARQSAGFHIALIRRLERALKQYREEMFQKEAEIVLLQKAARERLELIKAPEELAESLEKKEAVIDELKTALEQHREQGALLSRTAAERLDLIERLDNAVTHLRAQLENISAEMNVQAAAAQERAEVISDLAETVRARDNHIAELRNALDATKMDSTSKDLLINKLDEFLASQRQQVEDIRKVADERLAVITELDVLARERLQVIRSMNDFNAQ